MPKRNNFIAVQLDILYTKSSRLDVKLGLLDSALQDTQTYLQNSCYAMKKWKRIQYINWRQFSRYLRIKTRLNFSVLCLLRKGCGAVDETRMWAVLSTLLHD